MSSDKLAQAVRRYLEWGDAVRCRDSELSSIRKELSAALAEHEAEKQAPGFDECAASGESCSYGPHGPSGEMQCCYCGKAQAEKRAPDWQPLKRYGYAPGDYMTRCHTCGSTAQGVDKRAVTCRPCAEAKHESEKQAGPVAVQAPAPGDERAGFEARFPKPDELTWNGTGYDCEEGYENSYALNAYCAQWRAWQARALATAPPSPLTEQGKDDAEQERWTDDQMVCFAWTVLNGAKIDPGPSIAERLDAFRDIQIARGFRAARAKKEQP